MKHLRRFLQLVDGRELPMDEWLRSGWPRTILLLLIALPAIAAGPVRYLTGAGFALSYFCGLLLTLVVLAPLYRAARRPQLPMKQALAANGFVIALGVAAAAILYNKDFHGLVNYVDPATNQSVDGGVHISHYTLMLRQSEVYGGFVSLFSFWDILRRLTGDLLDAVNLSFFFMRFFVAAVPCVIAFALLQRHRDNRRVWWAGFAACVVSSLGAQYFLSLPLQAFHHMGGFWPHVFALIPMFLMWMSDVLIRQRFLRLVAVFAFGALYRYTYGLNLADLIAAVGILTLVEATGKKLPLWVRGLLVAGSIPAFLVAKHCYELSRPLFNEPGWIVQHDTHIAWTGRALLIAAMITTVFWWPERKAASGSGIARALRFPILVGIANLFFMHWIHELHARGYYYLNKYDFHAEVLLAGALVVLCVHWVTLAAGKLRGSTVAGLLVVLALTWTSVDYLRRGFLPYDEGFNEMVYGGPYQRSRAWVIPAAVKRMERILKAENKEFGGYVANHWPMLIFTNSMFDYKDVNWWRQPTLSATPGTCIFWDGGRHASLDRLPGKDCETYFQEPWGTIEVCGACF
jgi:hypothetical protein